MLTKISPYAPGTLVAAGIVVAAVYVYQPWHHDDEHHHHPHSISTMPLSAGSTISGVSLPNYPNVVLHAVLDDTSCPTQAVPGPLQIQRPKV